MNKFYLTAIIGIISYIAAFADNSLVITVEVPGTLKQQVLEADSDIIDSLTVAGQLNANDLEYLGSASGLISHIKTLDISKVNFVLDGGMYRDTSVASGSMGVKDINQYMLWPRDSVSGSSTLDGYVHQHWGNNLAAAFTDSKFEKVILPESIDALGGSAFLNAENLKEVVMGGNEKYIGMMAFKSAKKLERISLPESVDSIGDFAFEKAGNRLELDLSSVSRFGWECFSQSGVSKVILPNIETNLYPNMFSECIQLSSVTIPEKLKVLPEGMFSACSSLHEVTIEDGLEEIGGSAFYSCAIESIDLPNSVKIIGGSAFSDCKNLSAVNFPASLEALGGEVFKGTKVEKSFPVENSIAYFGTAAYIAKDFLPSHVTFREGTTILAGRLFDVGILPEPGASTKVGAYSIVNSVTLPESLRHIGENAFTLTNITSITFPEGLESIGDRAFANIPFERVSLPALLLRIGNEAFVRDSGSPTIKSVVFPDGLQEIGRRAFTNQLISEITLPESLKYIGGQAFSANTSLVTIKYNCRDAKVDLTESFYNSTCSPFFGSSCDRIFFGQRVTSIPDELFNLGYSNKFNVTKIELPQGILSIGSNAFKCLYSLTSVNFPEGLESIGNSAFFETGLQAAKLPNSIKNIEREAFYRSKLTELSLKENVEFIGDNAFGEITTLEAIEYDCIDAKTDQRIVQSQLGPYEFFGKPFMNSKCKKMTIGPDVRNISTYFFTKLDGISEISLPDGCELGRGAFSAMNSLNKVNLPTDLQTIPVEAFYKCYSLQNISIPQSVEIIGDYAFSGCFSLGHLELPVFISEIGEGAFYSAPFGEEINLGPNAVRIGKGAFCNCRNVERIFIPQQLMEIGNEAFRIHPDYANNNVTVISMIEDPRALNSTENGVFSDNIHWTLRIPFGTKAKYMSDPAWNTFDEYFVNDDMSIDLNEGFAADFTDRKDLPLDGVIIGKIYYSFRDGSYSGNSEYITIEGTGEIKDESLFDILTPYNYDLPQIFNGIVLKLPAGEGYLKIDSQNPETSLVVKIAGKDPVAFTNTELMSNTVDFNLSEDTFAYIYSASKGKESIIRALSVNSGQSAIDEIKADAESGVTERFHTDGRRASASSKGILIEKSGDGCYRKVIRK